LSRIVDRVNHVPRCCDDDENYDFAGLLVMKKKMMTMIITMTMTMMMMMMMVVMVMMMMMMMMLMMMVCRPLQNIWCYLGL